MEIWSRKFKLDFVRRIVNVTGILQIEYEDAANLKQ